MQTLGIPLSRTTTATITVLGSTAQPRMAARHVNTEKNTMKLQAQDRIAPGTAVRIDVEGGLVLGEVISASSDGSGYGLSIAIQHVVPSVASLANLVSAVMGYRRPAVENIPAALAESAHAHSVR